MVRLDRDNLLVVILLQEITLHYKLPLDGILGQEDIWIPESWSYLGNLNFIDMIRRREIGANKEYVEKESIESIYNWLYK